MPEATTKQPSPSDGLPPDAPQSARDAADRKMTVESDPEGEAEKGALDWILGGATIRPGRFVPVQYETPDGMRKLVFRILALDPSRITELENQHRKGAGPFADIDELPFNAALVAEATEYITDVSGRKIDLTSQEFRGDKPSPALALQQKFAFQGGLLDGVAGQVRRISGYDPQRVGGAERSLLEVGLG